MSEVVVRCEKQQCGTRYPLVLDALGRLTGTCPSCARRQRGLCQTCPSPVDGMAGRAKWCRACRVVEHRRQHQRYVNQDRERYNAMAAGRIRRKREVVKATLPPVDWPAVVAQRAASRTASLSPEQRREIAKKASQTRWKKYYQRQMLQRMREASA